MTKQAATTLAVGLCEQLRKARFLEDDGLSLNIMGSFGLATFPEDGDSVQNILRAADLAMYDAKRGSRNNVAVAGQGLVFNANPADRLATEPRGELRLTEKKRAVGV